MKNKKKITGTDMGIVFSIIGMIASIIVIIMNFIDGESKTVGIVLFCACLATLSANVGIKKEQYFKECKK